MTLKIRKVAAVVDISVPALAGDESERKYRGVLYESGELEYFLGDELYDFTVIDFVPNPIKLALDYILSWKALSQPEELENV